MRTASRILFVTNDRHQVVPGVDSVQSARPDQRSQHVPNRGPVLGFEEHRVLSHKDELLQRPLVA